MEKEIITGFMLDDKPVYDWKGAALGTVSTLRRDPRTNAARQLVVNLTPEAKTTIGTESDSLEIPISFVFGIRKDAVSLDRSTTELRHGGSFPSFLRK